MLCQQMFSFFTKSAYKLHLRLFLFIHGKSIQHVPTNKINLKSQKNDVLAREPSEGTS